MEKLLKAVEKAREQRSLREGREQNVMTFSKHNVSESNITYTQTKSISLSKTQYQKSRIIQGSNNQAVVDAYKILRTQILTRMNQNNWKSLAITSSKSKEGKSLTAINLAISLSKEVNHTVLLVDLDFRHPSIHEYFFYKPTAGITDYLLNDIPLSDTMINPGIPRLVLIPGRENIMDSSELLCAPKMTKLNQELVTKYPDRIVIYDLPPLLASDDAIAFLPKIDAALIVIEEGKTTSHEIQQATEMLNKTPLVGTILNKTKEKVMVY